MSKSLIGFIVFFVLAIGATLVWVFNSPEETAEPSVEASFTAAEVEKHNTADDCWTIIGGAVFDVTEYITSHPGGSEILRACGTDATSLFLQRQTSDGQPVGSGSPHSSSAESRLGSYFIGDLDN